MEQGLYDNEWDSYNSDTFESFSVPDESTESSQVFDHDRTNTRTSTIEEQHSSMMETCSLESYSGPNITPLAMNPAVENAPTETLSVSKDGSMMRFCTLKLNVLAANTCTNSCTPDTETTCVTSPESAAHKYQNVCINRLKNHTSKSSHNVEVIRRTDVHCESSRQQECVGHKYSTRQVEQIKLDALYHRMSTQIKEIDNELMERKLSVCNTCRQQRYKIAEAKFVRHKVNFITKPIVERRLEEHLYQRDPLSLLGEVVNTCVHPSAPNETLWQVIGQRLTELEKKKTT